MNVVLVKEEEIVDKGYNYEYAERLPDGRIVLPLNSLKVLSNITPTIVSLPELDRLRDIEVEPVKEEEEVAHES